MAGAKHRARKAAHKAKGKGGKRRSGGCAACKSGCADLEKKHRERLANMKEHPNAAMKDDVKKFAEHYQANKAHYEALGNELDYPPEIIAIDHWRESHGDFTKNLANGEPLGRTTRKVPKGMDFKDFDDSARYAFKKFAACKAALGMNKDTKDRAKAAAFLENYNGHGYYNKGVASPYVYSGTDQYTSGKYVETLGADGAYHSQYMPGVVDQQTGGILLYDSIAPTTQDAPVQDSRYIPTPDSPLYNPAKLA